MSVFWFVTGMFVGFYLSSLKIRIRVNKWLGVLGGWLKGAAERRTKLRVLQEENKRLKSVVDNVSVRKRIF